MDAVKISPVALMLALLARMHEQRPEPVAKFRCRFCHEPVGPALAEAPGCAVHPANGCRFGKQARTEHGPCAIPRSAAEPLGRNYFMR
jgi:hypothetical protein